MDIYVSKEYGRFVVISPTRIESIMEGYCPDCGSHMNDTDLEAIGLPVFHCPECEEDHCEAFHMIPLADFVDLYNGKTE